ncbi:RagB/SusD family nutrient uptake outer membrane protein [Fodinibius sp. Rm-B-1B1-1]|uniref:RagB/SusD family nutrient uptake outer membrane protein n=1 Tax=Fodinibius alkaliphilus TaxID=3140241 RepID=UPI00315A5A4A
MKNIFKNITTALLVVFVVSSCDVTNQTPQQSLPSETVLTTEDGANSTLAGAYSAYQEVIEDDYVFAELAADYAGHSGSYPSWASVNQHNLLPTNAEGRDMWIEYYELINITNNLIGNVPDIEEDGFSDAEKNQIVAEAKILRALAYHSLVRYFGGVPLITTPTTSLGEESFVERSSVSAVYDQIVTDLEQAESTLGADGSANSRTATGYTAKALLARVHLYQGNHGAAEDYATEVIDSGTFALGTYEGLFGNTPSTAEPIFRLEFTSEDDNSLSFFARPNGYGGRREYAPTSDYTSAFANEDMRELVNLTDFDPSEGNGSELAKYFELEGNDDVIIVRLAEMYLIRAEARGLKDTPDYGGVASDLNMVQRRAYENQEPSGGPYSTDYAAADFTSDQEVIDAVMYQRGLELAQEGHRWFDYKRLGMATSQFGIDQAMTLWPIPQREMDSNPNLEQNPGY